MKTIILKNQAVEYLHRHRRGARRLRLSVGWGGRVAITTPVRYSEGELEKFLNDHADWILDKLKFYKEKEVKSIFPKGKNDYVINKSAALKLVRSNLAKLNDVYKFNYNKVTIRNQSSRWGSCAKNGNLNFNYKLIYLPAELVEYVVAHELCHLKEMNHGKNFWNLVEKTIPDYIRIRKQLKKTF